MEQSKFFQIKNITEHKYTLVGCDGSVITRPIQDVDKSASVFTIQDAKDGDVLVYGDNPNDHHVEVIMIFKLLRDKYSAYTHFHIFKDVFRTNNWCDLGKKTHPATKEQRDLLFTKMKEEGYEWDAEQKDLKKIEDEPENYKKQLMSEMADLVVDYIQQKPTWKPTEKQIDAIRLARSFVTDDFSDNPTLSETLLELEKQLKKIMEK